jgi:adenosine 3'-phospho 5'-phosphosulfate transporter B3
VLIISCALLADAFLGNLQEKTLQQFDVSSREMVYYSHIIGSGYLLAITVAVGQFGPAFKYCWEFDGGHSVWCSLEISNSPFTS